MRSPYGLQIVESCIACPVRNETFACNLSAPALKALNSIKATAAYPRGAILCLEGQPPRGIFILCSGRAKVYSTSKEGKNIILRIAEPGEIIGLSAAISGDPYEATVETLQPSQVNFIPRADFLALLQRYPDAALKIGDQLVHNCKRAYEEIRSLGLSHTVSEKLAKLLLHWADHARNGSNSNELQIKVSLTHDEIAQMIGSSRETVTRIFGELKRKNLIRVRGASLTILNRAGLERMIRPRGVH